MTSKKKGEKKELSRKHVFKHENETVWVVSLVWDAEEDSRVLRFIATKTNTDGIGH